MRIEAYELIETVIKAYFKEFRKNLKRLDSNFYRSQQPNQRIQQELALFFESQFHSFAHIYTDAIITNKNNIARLIRTRGGDLKLIITLKEKRGKTKAKPKSVMGKIWKECYRFGKRIRGSILKLRLAGDTTVNLLHFFSSITDHQIDSLTKQILKHEELSLESAFNSAEDFNAIQGKKCSIVSHVFATTWHPTLTALQNNNWSVACLPHSDVLEHTGYGCMQTTEINPDALYFVNFLGAITFALQCQNKPFLFSGETYHGSQWNAVNATFMFLNLSVILSTIRKLRDKNDNNLILFMYDGLKPVNKLNEFVKSDLSKFYKRLMQQADKIIYNSNTERLGDYVENTYGIKAPRTHFYRLCERLNDEKRQRLPFGKNNDEFHVVSITSFTDRACCSSRKNTYLAVKAMLEQGIHFHYYSGDGPQHINWFLSTVNPAYRSFFHLHPVNRNQQFLVNELHQYHAGFNGSDFLPYAKAIDDLKENDNDYGTGLLNFMLSTFGTSFHVYAAAGLPPILPGMCTDSAQYYKDFCVPMNLCEFKNAKEYFVKIGLQKMCLNYKEFYERAVIDKHIHKLTNFIDPKNNSSFEAKEQALKPELITSMH